MIDVSTLSLDDLRRLYPIVSRYDAESARVTGAKTMADLFRIQTAMFQRLDREDKMFVRRDLVEIGQALEAAASMLGRKGGAAGRGPAKRRDVDYAKLGRKGARRRGAIKRGFETVSSWRGHYPALIYWTVGGEIEIVFDDANTLSRPGDFAREITRPRCQDDIPGTLAAFRRLLDYVPIDEAK